MTPVGGGIHTKPHERLPRALILGLMGVLDRAYPWPLWYRDKRTRTSAGLECVIQEQSSFELSYMSCTLFRSRPLLSTTPLEGGCFLHEGLPSLTIKGRARARALDV